MNEEDITHRFKYHKPNEQKAERHQAAREVMMEAAFQIDSLCDDGREKSLAITKLEEAMFWTNAAIARNP